MFKDYSGAFIMAQGRIRTRTAKRKLNAVTGELFPAARLIWKTIGVMVLVTLVIGISSTIWYGLKVQVALNQIGNSRTVNYKLQNENSLLLVQRDLLLTRSQMEEAAQKLGLSAPGKNQLRYP